MNGTTTMIALENHYHVECIGPDGKLKWEDEFDNLVTTEGLNDNLTQYLKGSAYTAAFYVGLTGTDPNPSGWRHHVFARGLDGSSDYSEGTREVLTLGTAAAGSIDNSASKASYSINGTATVGGAFVTTNSTKGGTTGTLYGVGAFTGGDKSVSSGDTLNVTVTCTAAAA